MVIVAGAIPSAGFPAAIEESTPGVPSVNAAADAVRPREHPVESAPARACLSEHECARTQHDALGDAAHGVWQTCAADRDRFPFGNAQEAERHVLRSPPSDRTFDYVIVGAGAAGSIVAARLAQDPGVSVCVLEAGPSDLRPFVYLPAGFTKTLTQQAVTWQFKTEPTENTAGRRIPTVQGRVVGGSGSINGLVYNRGQPADYDHWSQLGNPGWSYRDVLPYFKRSETRIGEADDAVRGRSGPLPVTDMDWLHPVSEAFIETAAKSGFPRNPDYNAGEQEGVGYFQ